MGDSSDARLHDRLVAGDDDALAEAYDRWSGLVHTVAVRITADHGAAEDVTQEVFVRLWERPQSYDPSRGALRAWLCMNARGRAIDWLRRWGTRGRDHATAVASFDSQADIDEAITSETEAKVVRDAVATLPDPQRVAVRLAYYHGHTYREVARKLDIPEGTAKYRLRTALSTLADRLEAEGILER
jgi:RNA polymerase sigma-70 factor (ECF subfamily)